MKFAVSVLSLILVGIHIFVYFWAGSLPLMAFAAGSFVSATMVLFLVGIGYFLLIKKLVAFGIALVVVKLPVLGGMVWGFLALFKNFYQFNAVGWLIAGTTVFLCLFAIGSIRAFYLV